MSTMKHEVTSFARLMPGGRARRDVLHLATNQRLWCDARVTGEKEKAAVKTKSVSARRDRFKNNRRV
jgi:hypothetical protein